MGTVQAPPHLRGTLSQLWQLVLTAGLLVAQLVNVGTAKIVAGWGWRLSLGLGAVPAIALIIGGIFLPDTPNSLIERGHVEEVKILQLCVGKCQPAVNISRAPDRSKGTDCARIIASSKFLPPNVPLPLNRTIGTSSAQEDPWL